MGIGCAVQWADTTTQLAEHFGMRESISIPFSLRRLRWLGHVVCMPDDRIQTEFYLDGFLGIKLWWRDKV